VVLALYLLIVSILRPLQATSKQSLLPCSSPAVLASASLALAVARFYKPLPAVFTQQDALSGSQALPASLSGSVALPASLLGSLALPVSLCGSLTLPASLSVASTSQVLPLQQPLALTGLYHKQPHVLTSMCLHDLTRFSLQQLHEPSSLSLWHFTSLLPSPAVSGPHQPLAFSGHSPAAYCSHLPFFAADSCPHQTLFSSLLSSPDSLQQPCIHQALSPAASCPHQPLPSSLFAPPAASGYYQPLSSSILPSMPSLSSVLLPDQTLQQPLALTGLSLQNFGLAILSLAASCPTPPLPLPASCPKSYQQFLINSPVLTIPN
jgi:hypothetical protein